MTENDWQIFFIFIFCFPEIPVSDLSLVLAYSFTLVGSVQWFVRLSVDVMMQVKRLERWFRSIKVNC